MQKFLFTFSIMAFLTACTSQTTDEEFYSSSNWLTEVEVLSPSQVQTQPDEFIQELQTIKENLSNNKQEEKLGYMEQLAEKLRKELLGSGVRISEVSGQIDLIVPNTISFGNSQKTILPTFSSNLSTIALLLKEYDRTMIQIIGYTDNTTSVLAGKETSLQKANMLADFLKGQGIDAGRIITDGAGDENPLATNETPIGREQNRRVEITLISLQ